VTETLDTQQTEIIGRQRVVAELIRADVEVAIPIRDYGVDLVAYIDINEQVTTMSNRGSNATAGTSFVAVPIQLKVSSKTRFSIHAKYARISNLLLVYVWHIAKSYDNTEIYALTYTEALSIANKMKWTKTSSWIDQGGYSAGSISKELRKHLEAHRMTTDKWRSLLRRVSSIA
jgi:hypothetical protein